MTQGDTCHLKRSEEATGTVLSWPDGGAVPKFTPWELAKSRKRLFTVDGERDRNSPTPEYKLMA